KTRILVLSDTHGHSHLPHPLSLDLNIDVVLHCGDLSQCGSLEDYRNTIELLNSIPAPLKLVIAGNHDLTLDHQFWSSNSTHEGHHLYDAARSLFVFPSTREARIKFLDEGTHSFSLLNGASMRVYASPFTPNHSRVPEWAFGYRSNHDRFNPQGKGISYGTFAGTPESVIPSSEEEEIDVVMTHTPSRYRLDRCWGGDNLGCPHLFRGIRRTRPRLHVFGHVHEGNGAELVSWEGRNGGKLPDDDDVDDGIVGKLVIEGRWEEGVKFAEIGEGKKRLETLFVNGALMGRDDRLSRMPWLVEVEL
ncbi:hypothetical protein BDZ45DRAFT_575639, partial [Acephala macrosclerotiorum]